MLILCSRFSPPNNSLNYPTAFKEPLHLYVLRIGHSYWGLQYLYLPLQHSPLILEPNIDIIGDSQMPSYHQLRFTTLWMLPEWEAPHVPHLGHNPLKQPQLFGLQSTQKPLLLLVRNGTLSKTLLVAPLVLWPTLEAHSVHLLFESESRHFIVKNLSYSLKGAKP